MNRGLKILQMRKLLVIHNHTRQAPVLTNTFKPQGCVAAPFTPFKQNGEVDLSKFPDYFKHLKEFGVPSVFVTGTTGEGLSLTVEERKAVVETWMKGKPSLDYVIAHIGTGNLKDSQALAQHAESVAADAIACIAPNYYKPQTVEALVEYMAEVANCAPNTPFYLYDINFMTQVYLSNPRFLELAEEKIPTLVGIKHSSPELNSLTRCHEYRDKKYQIMLGSDDTLLPALAVGIDVSVPSSYMAPLQNRLREAYFRGDIEKARLEQHRCCQVAAIRSKYGSGAGLFAVSRAVMAMVDIDLGPPRLPLQPLGREACANLKQELSDIEFFKWVK